MSADPSEAPPAGEEVHLPGPSFVPIWNAVGITLMIVGITVGKLFLIVGALIFLYTLFRWIRDVRTDIASLPEEHG